MLLQLNISSLTVTQQDEGSDEILGLSLI